MHLTDFFLCEKIFKGGIVKFVQNTQWNIPRGFLMEMVRAKPKIIKGKSH